MARLVADPEGTGDVIVAPATAPGAGAVAIVRLSGPAGRAVSLARRVAPALPERPRPRHALLSEMRGPDGAVVDEGLVLPFLAPRSATGEEVVELHCHGAPVVVSALVDACVAAGARRARPGEFTRRALANGRIDLAGAEGIGRLVTAASPATAARALGLVRGALSARVAAVRETLLTALSSREALLDFPEDVEPPAAGEDLDGLEASLGRLADLLAPAREALPVPTVVLAGAPNAGKSTLFNALLGWDRAIVTPAPGTTRDAVSETTLLAGRLIRLVDTAGLRGTEDEAERLGVEAAGRAAAAADLVLLVAAPGDETAVPAGRRVVVAAQADRRSPEDRTRAEARGERVVCALHGEGLDALRREIVRRLDEGGAGEPAGEFLAIPRHRDAVTRAHAAVRAAREVRGAVELEALLLREALTALGEVTGETATEELLDRLFSTFCIGK